MPTDQTQRRWRRELPSWAASVLLHVGVLILLAMIPYLAARAARPPAEATIMLRPPAGADALGVEDPGGAGGRNVVERRAMRPADSYAQAPAAVPPEPRSMSRVLAQLPVPELRPEMLAGSADPSGELLANLAEVSRKGTARGGGLGALLAGTSKSFGRHVGALRGRGLDLVLVLDATDSMTPTIEQAKKRLHAILDVVTGLVPNARFGVVAFKDYGDDYGPEAVRHLRLTTHAKAVRTFIDEIASGGGADEPEPIHEALKVATDRRRIGWRPGRMWVVLLVGDSTIHPSGRKQAFDLARGFSRRAHGTINVIDVGGTGRQGKVRSAVRADLKRVAEEGGGSAFLLTDEKLFWRSLVVSVFGARFEQDVDVIIRKLVRER